MWFVLLFSVPSKSGKRICDNHVEFAVDGAKEVQRMLEISSITADEFYHAVSIHLFEWAQCSLNNEY
jgi:hypothetical protein